MLRDFFSIFAKSIFLLLICSYQNHQRNLRQQEHVRDGEADVIETPAENIEQPNENDANVENNNQGINEPVNQNQATPTSTESNTTTTTTTSSASEVEENNRLPTITLLRTFILSFFSSLIPETPAA